VTEGTDNPGWARVDDDEEPSAPLQFQPEPSLEDYQPLEHRALPARAWLVVVTLLYVVALVFDISERSLLASIGTDDPATLGELEASDDRQLVITLAIIGATLTAAGFFIAWLKRAYTNLRALGVRNLRWGPGWTIGSWFVPLLNLVLPKQLVNDVWRGSDPELEDSETWRDKPVPVLFALWWGAWIVGSILDSAAAGMFDSAEGSDEFEVSSGVAIAGDVLLILAGFLAVVVVDRTTTRQAAAVAAAGGGEHPGARARRWLSSAPRFAAAAALCCVAAGLGVLTVVAQPAGSTAVASDDTSDPEPAGEPASFETIATDDFSNPASGWTEEDTADVEHAYEDGEYRISAISPELSRFSLLDFAVPVDHVLLEVDATLRSPASDEDGVGIGCYMSEAAGYVVSIWPDGFYEIGLDPVDTETISTLANGTSRDAIEPAGSVNRIGIECDSGLPATVTLTVNGRPVAEAQHDEALRGFHIVALVVVPGPDGATAHFDNLALSATR
jgi:hypothetical protein